MDDVEALSTIVSILRKLDEKTQQRVLASVHMFFDVPQKSGGGFKDVQERSSRGDESQGEQSFSRDRVISPKDFLRDKQPVTDVDRVTCLAYYLTHYKQTPHFKTVDISSLNIEAAQPKFSSASVAVDNARARGLLVPSTKGNKQISAIGEKYVELLPDKDAAMSAITSSKLRRVAKKSARGKKAAK
ncbi:hypothetical protein [Xanthomonas arboricola]|uniref:hypothetical protein n=1 Tax=Xanthomonas arboricola TaxID=56448 RepID=UPI001268F348|nr:hypothetical protein [Xanthomonas arboricola]